MSEVIDSRIVEMRFDNSQFESNVRESLKTIDHLKSSLDFEDSVKGLEHIKVDIDASGAVQGLNAISDAAEDCDLSQISNSAESVKLSFTALEIVAVTALGKIASAAIDAGAKAVNAFALQPITDGFAEYNQQLKSTRVITSNTGQSLEEVTKVLDELNEYADLTIYSFGDMTQAMGYFTSALGENSAKNSATIAKGISNWAASTGQGNEVAKRVMYQVSQALSTGMFRLQDWKSIENTGAMAGARYQKAFIETAAEMYGTTYEEFNKYIEQEYGSFRESLTKGEWLTNDVFLETMKKFANEDGSGMFQWMEDAATKVLTFSDLLDTVREQLGTGWGETWKTVFGTYEESIDFFTGISKSIGDFINITNKARNEIFDTWADKGGRTLLFGDSEENLGAIGDLLNGILEILSQVHEAFIDAFGSDFLVKMLLGATQAVSDFAKAFDRLSHLTIIHDVLRSIFSVLKSIFSIASSIYKIIEPLISLALNGVEKILSGVSKITDLTANVIDKVAVKISSLTEKITEPFQIASNFISGTFGMALDYVSEKASSIWNFLKQFDILGIFPENIPKEVGSASERITEFVGGISAANKAITDTTKATEKLGDQWWDLISEEDKNQYFAPQFWGDLSDEQREEWRKYAEEKKLYNAEEYEALAKSSKKTEEISRATKKTNESLEQSYNSAVKIGESVSITSTDLKKSDDSLKDISKDVDKVNVSLKETEKTSKSVKERLAALGVEIKSENDLKGDGWQDVFWNAMNKEKRDQHFAVELWEAVKDTDDLINGDNIAKTWIDTAFNSGYFDAGVYEELNDIWEQWAHVGKYASESVGEVADQVEKVNKNLEKTPSKVSISLSLGDSEKPEAVKDWWDLISEEDKNQYFAPELWNDLDEKQREEWKKRAEAFELFNVQEYEKIKRSSELSQSYDWWDLIGENDKSKYFIAEYWDDLTDSQKEYWKQYALGLKLFTEEELAQLESTEKTVKDILDDRDKVVQKKRTEADLWWDLIDEDKKKQYFMGEYWDVLNEHERESWRKRAEEYKLFDPEEYAKLLEEMRDAEKEAFAPEVSEDIVESSESIETWYDKASKIPIIGGFLKDFSWVATKTVKNAKSFGSAVKDSFGDFINYAKYINSTDLTFFQKLNLEASYFKEHVAGYLGDLIAKNFKSIGNVISNSDIATKLKTFTTSVKDRFIDFKSYVKDINENTALTFPEKYKLSLEYFKTNVLGTIGGQIKEKFIELGENIKGNKIVTNAASFISAVKTKFGDFKSYISDLNSNTELTFPQKLTKALEFLKTNVIDYFLELINKNLKSVGIDIKKIGEEISNAFETAISLIITTLNVFGIDTEAIKKFFWNDDGTLKSIPEIITALGDQIEKALIEVKTRLLNLYESFFPSTEEGKLTGPLGWIISAKEKVDGFIESIFGSNKKVKAAQKETPSNGLLPAVLGILGLGGGSSIMKTVGNLNSLFSFGKNLGISGNINYSKIAIGVALAAGAFALLSKVNFKQLGIDFSGFTNYFKDGEGNLLTVSEIMDKVGQSLSKNKIGKWVVETSQLIGRNFSSAFNLLKDNTVFFGQFIGSLNETDLTFPQKFSLAATFFKDHFVVPFGDLVKKNLKHIGIDIDGFLAKFKNSEGGWLTIADHIKILGDKISAEVEALKQKFDQTALGKWINEQIEKFKAEHPKITAWIESVGENISKVFKKIGELPGLIGRNVSSFFIDFAEFFGNFKKHVKELNEKTELTFPEKFKTALEYFKKDFIDPFAEIAKRNLKTIGIDIDAFINYFKDNEGKWLSIGEIITKVGNSIRDAFQDLKTKFEQSKFGQWLTEKFNGLSTWFDNFKNLASKFAAPVIGGAGIFLAIRGIFQLFDFVNSIGRIYSGRTPINEANAFARSVEALSIIIKDIAVAVFIIAASLGGLAMLNQDDLTRASDSITHVLTVVGVIMGALTIIAAIRSRTKETNSASLAVLELAGAVFAIAMAFKLITSIQMFDESGNLKLRNLIADFSVLGTLMLMTIGFGRLAPNIEGSKSSFVGMIAIATAVLEMVGALYLVQLMLESHSGVFWALVTLGGLIGAFAILCNAARGVNWKSGLGLILMARSIRTMLDSLEYVLDSDLFSKLAGNNLQDFLINIGKIVTVYAALLGLAYINNASGRGRAGLNLLSVAASVLVLAHAIELITEIDEERLWPAVAVVSVLSFVMGLILIGYSALGKYSNTSLRAMVTNAVQLYSVVIAAILLCGAVALLATMDQAKLSSSALIVGALTTIVGLISIFMSNATGHNSLGENLATLTAVTLVAVAMGALIYALDRYIPDKSNLMTIAGTISLLTGVVGTFAIIFGELDLYYGSMKHVGRIGAVLGEIAIVVAAMGAVLTLVVRNIPQDTRWDRLLSIAGAVSIMTAVVSGLAMAFGSIKNLSLPNVPELLFTLLSISSIVVAMGAVITVMANLISDDMPASKLWNIVGTVSVMTAVVSGLAMAFGSIKNLKFPNSSDLLFTLWDISTVVIIMAAVIGVMANVISDDMPASKLWNIVGTVSAMTVVVSGLAMAFGKIKSLKFPDSSELFLTLFNISTVVIIMAAVLGVMANVIPDDTSASKLWNIVGTVSVMTAVVSGITLAFGKIKDLTFPDFLELGGTLLAISVVVGLMAAVMAIMANVMPDDATSSKLWNIVGTVSVMTAVVSGITMAFGKIKDLKFPNFLELGGTLLEISVVVALMGLVLSMTANLLPENTDSSKLSGIVKSISVLSGVVAALALVFGNININLSSATKGALALGAIGLVVEALFAFIVIIIGWQKDNIDKAVSIIERLGKGFAKIFDQVMTTIGKLNWWQLVALIGVVAGAVAALALFGPEIAIGIVVFGAAIAVFAAEMAAAAIVCVGLLDITLPWFEQFATEGVPIFEKIAEGIVKIATIIIDGIVANVRTIIDCLVDFVAFASVGFDDEKVGKVVDLATQITKIIGAFMGDDFLGMLGKAAGEWLFGAYNRESFLKNVRTITDALNIVKTETADWTPLDESRITLATTIAGQLVRIVDAFTETNFLTALGKWSVEKAFGNFNRETFEKNVQAICGGLNKFVTGINEIENFDEAKILNAETVADKMIVLVQKFQINGIDDLINTIVNILFSEDNAKSFNKAIEQIDAAVVDFCSKVNLWVLPSDYESKFGIVDKMIEFVTGMPVINPDQMSIDAFGDAIKAFAKSFLEATFYLNSTLSKNNIEDYSGKMETIDDLIALSAKLPDAASAMGTFFGYKTTEDLKTFSDKFVVFAGNLQTFATEMNKVKPIKKWDDKKAVVEDLIALAKLLPEDVSGLDQAISLDPIKSNLAIFGQQIAEFSEWFNAAVADINEINITDATFAKYTQMETLVRCLIGLTNLLPESYTISDVSGNAQTMSTFTRSLSSFMNDIMGEQNAFVGGFSNSIFDRVRQVYAELDEIGELTKNGQAALDNITSEDGVLHKLAGLAGSLPEASKNSSTLTQFGQEIYNLSESLSSAYYTVEGLATTSGDDKESFNSGPFEEIAKGVASIIDSFADISSEDLVHIDSIFDSLRHLKTDEGAGLGEVLLGLAGDFIGEPGKKFTDAVAGAGSASTFLGNLAGLGDTLNSIVPEGGIQLGDLETVFGQFNAESGSFDEGGVLSAIPTSITEFNDLFGENGSIDISNATDAFKNMFNFDASSLNINSDGMKSLFGVFTQGSGFDGTGILNAIPGEFTSYITSIKDIDPDDIAITNENIHLLTGGVLEAGSITPDMSTNFNTTLSAFATNGITSYTNTFKSEDTIALVNDATTTLVSKTGQGIEAAIKKKPNDLDTACKSTVKMISDILSGDNTNPYSVPGPFILNKTGKGINDALKSSSKTLKDSVKSTVSLIVEILSGDSTNPYSVPGPNILNKLGNGISSALTSSYSTLSSAVNSVVSYVANILSGNSSNPNPYTQAGENAVSGFVAGLSKTDNVYKAAYDIGSLALRGLDDSTDSHSPSKEAEKRGEYIGEGLKNGIDSYKDAIENELDGIYLYDKFSSDFLNMMGDIVGVVDEEGVFWAGETLGNAAIDGIAYVIKSNSPSKEAMKYGKYFSEGFALGISSYSDAVETTSENVGSDALNGLASYVAKVYDLLDSGLEFSPTITPVLDLSELKDGVELANAMFSKQQAYSANMEVKGAIRARTDSARAVSNTDNSRNFGGFTFNIYTQGTDADSIARQIGAEVTRKLRISGALI